MLCSLGVTSSVSRALGMSVLACVAVCCTTACSTSVDVVATRKEIDAGDQYLTVRSVHGCKPGFYSGIVSSVADADANLQFPFTARIDFALVESRGTGEFLTLQSQGLKGQTDNGAWFSADITGGNGCQEGNVDTDLSNGKYSFSTSPDATVVPFEGPIHGLYSESTRGFTGTWRAQLPGVASQVVAQGTWTAIWIHSCRDALCAQ